LIIDGEADRNLITVTNPGTPQQQVNVVSHPGFVADDTVFPTAKTSLLVADSTAEVFIRLVVASSLALLT
jgi:Fe-S cluster assembly iron-binding protein IscA